MKPRYTIRIVDNKTQKFVGGGVDELKHLTKPWLPGEPTLIQRLIKELKESE